MPYNLNSKNSTFSFFIFKRVFYFFLRPTRSGSQYIPRWHTKSPRNRNGHWSTYLVVVVVVAVSNGDVAEGRPCYRDLELLVQITDEYIAPRGLAHARQRHGSRQHRYVLVDVLVDVGERYDVVVLAVVGARELLDLARIGHVAADLEGEDADAFVGVVLGEEVVDVVRVAVGDDHDHLVAAGALEPLVAEHVEDGLERRAQLGLLARVLEGVETLLELQLVLLARLDEGVGVDARLVVQQELRRVREGEYVEEVVVGKGVEYELDELLADLQAQARHRATRIEQDEHVLGRGGRHDVPCLEAAVEEVLAGHGPVGGRVAAEEALCTAKVLPEELVVGIVVALELLVEPLGPVGRHVDGHVLLEDVNGHLEVTLKVYGKYKRT
jgi:hypothetical protein